MTQGKTKVINHVVRRKGNKVLNFMKSKEKKKSLKVIIYPTSTVSAVQRKGRREPCVWFLMMSEAMSHLLKGKS